MASSAGENAAICEAEAGAGKKNRRRICDFLGDSDGSDASPPRPLRLPRFTCARFRFGRKRSVRKAVPVANKTDDASVDSSAAAGALAVSWFRRIFVVRVRAEFARRSLQQDRSRGRKPARAAARQRKRPAWA
jgi:hypothetical protein